jgi:hypothetical protein
VKPVVLLVGADKGGVGKTTIVRTLLDYLPTRGAEARAFDTEFPRGTLKRFFPKVTELIDITTAADQMKVLDTLTTSEVKVSIVDVRAGSLLNTLKTFTDVGFFDLCRAGEFNFLLFHVIGPSFASLEEIAEVLPYTNGLHYFVVKNFINETSFFDWHPEIRTGYFKLVKNAVEVHIPKLNELAYEQTELGGVPFSTFIANKTVQGDIANYSLVLRHDDRSKFVTQREPDAAIAGGSIADPLPADQADADNASVGREPTLPHHEEITREQPTPPLEFAFAEDASDGDLLENDTAATNGNNGSPSRLGSS